jgi:hypothetical protein
VLVFAVLMYVSSPITRTPGRYYEIDTITGKQIKKPEKRLRNTNEAIHPCVRIRINEHGLGTEKDSDTSVTGKLVDMVKHYVLNSKDVVGQYNSAALANYTLVQPGKKFIIVLQPPVLNIFLSHTPPFVLIQPRFCKD